MACFVDRLIESKTIAVGCTARDWEEAVRIGGRMMIDAGLIDDRYVQTMISNHREIGPYFIVAPGIAMPHAKPENGVLKTGYALVTLASPVEFGDEENDPVDVLIFAGAANREEHNQEAVPQIAELCDSEKYVYALRNARNNDEAVSVLQNFAAAFEAGEFD
ncbi:PTS ascorbate-specific transporter subunit IIA [Marispirochaeta aestuarii]|uniref:Ascorbate-specific PTS system EIIA component n=1 Tax=Marispirochaeta aestuarii TaxID=1963862 RepID=A0A1Y1RYX8_9SPIO|nr:PTS sugar transporter subunit IIA [Marispirochaeta aestuarii]ORC35869.1 PTS ascorbate-specific transporter subunit IIA [Marispirochaeta aestuarii]